MTCTSRASSSPRMRTRILRCRSASSSAVGAEAELTVKQEDDVITEPEMTVEDADADAVEFDGRWSRVAGLPGSGPVLLAPLFGFLGSEAASALSDAAPRFAGVGAMIPGGGRPRGLPPKRPRIARKNRVVANTQATEGWQPRRLRSVALRTVGWRPRPQPTVPLFHDQDLTQLRRRSPSPLCPWRRGAA